MRTVFLHGEIEQCTAAKAELVDRFAKWCTERSIEAPAELAVFVLDERSVRDGLLARWSEQDVEQFLVEVVPRRLALDGSWSAVPEFLRLWIEFLADTGVLSMPAGISGAALHGAIDRAVPAYVEAMAEPREWGPAKFWAVTMAEHGVDADDEDAVDSFFADVDSGAVRIEEEVLDRIEERDDEEPVRQPAYWLPPMVVPDEVASAAEVADVSLLIRLRGLRTWLGSGREVLEDGELGEADREELAAELDVDRFQVDVMVEWALLAGLVRVTGTRLVPTQVSGPLLEEPAVLWSRLWRIFPLLDEVFGAENFDEVSSGAEVFAELVQHALRTLYSQSDAVPLELLIDMTTSSLLQLADEKPDQVAAPDREEVRSMARRVVEQWVSMGLVRCFAAEDPARVAAIDEAVPAGVQAEHTLVELAPWAVSEVRESLRDSGFLAPTVEEVVGYPAEVMVLTLPDSPPDVAKEVIAGWVGSRGEQAASAELAQLLARVDDPLVRLTALWLLERVGPSGVDAVAGLADDPVAGPAARVWLQSRGSSAAVVPQPDDELALSLDGMAVTAGEDASMFLEEFQQQPTTDQIAVVEQIPRTRHVGARTVLEVIVEGHPDERVVSVARRALDRMAGAS
jgi:hypothetical protein